MSTAPLKQVTWALSLESSPFNSDTSLNCTLNISNGIYEGDLREQPNAGNGLGRMRHGNGTMKYSNGNMYVGEWLDDRFDGVGEYIWADGRRFIGGFKSDKIEGRGTGFWPDGRIYEGEYKSDLVHGHGLVTLQSGKSFEGTFADDFPLEGQMIESDGTMYSATFDGKTHVSEWRATNRTLVGKFEGWTKPGCVHMMREFVWVDGRRFAGSFNGFCPLVGVLTEIDGTQYLAAYEGKLLLVYNPIPEVKFLLKTQVGTVAYLSSPCIPSHCIPFHSLTQPPHIRGQPSCSAHTLCAPAYVSMLLSRNATQLNVGFSAADEPLWRPFLLLW